ncbi:hypothetical protein RBI14_03255 [Alcaligenaceae bacterium B3P038]|nr:hypothetical protein [Alcaligenaceae bacterium B3P038]
MFSPFAMTSLRALPDGAAAVPPRPLSAIAATRAGAVPQARIRQVIAEMIAPLSALHAEGRIHGGISTDTIGLAEGGHAQLLAPASLAPRSAGDTALREGRATGFNAFEQYTDDPAWAVGPWTDIYALSAVACSLVSGTVPPSAIDRCVRDDYVPLTARAIVGYETAFLSAIDAGLSMPPSGRPQSLQAFADALGIFFAPAPVAAPVRAAASVAPLAAVPAGAAPAPVSASVPAPSAAAVATPAGAAGADAGSAAAPSPVPAAATAATAATAAPIAVPAAVSTQAVDAAMPAPFAERTAPARSVGTPPVGIKATARKKRGSSAPWLLILLVLVGGGIGIYMWLQDGFPHDTRAPVNAGSGTGAGMGAGTGTPAARAPEAVAGASGSAGVRPAAPSPAASPANGGATGNGGLATAPAAPVAPPPEPPPLDSAGRYVGPTAGVATPGASSSATPSAPAGQGAAPGVPTADSRSAANGVTGASAVTGGNGAGAATGTNGAGVATGVPGAVPGGVQATASDAPVGAAGVPTDPNALPPLAGVEPPIEKPVVVPQAVSINVQPWGEVFVNGASRGVSPPLRQLRLAPGQYTISIRNSASEPYTTRLTVQAGRPASISHTFK